MILIGAGTRKLSVEECVGKIFCDLISKGSSSFKKGLNKIKCNYSHKVESLIKYSFKFVINLRVH